ncbi:hypothetical protein FV139_17440 [Parahaliea maris]|uniref:PNPLA domain-containing protein n=1 Tax=Parahaliea maris TaxID=2716870 RepID=A0A5C8ZT57_9GAMM|nr:patatin-like phospholipase family protein [Parahaliea maris]TXS90762.1 hypothetical protein FV139_17440 [Parahaliea maris]
MEGPGQGEFREVVFPEELVEVARRREQVDPRPLPQPQAPSVDNELVGLAISGGGIRSATFALGAVQGLARHGLLRHVDYLSTVSGGGYLGACISSLLTNPKAGVDASDFPLRYTRGCSEPAALTHVRNCSNYLDPGGLLNTLRIPVLLLRGMLLNLCVFLPYILGAVIVTQAVYLLGPDTNWLPRVVMPLLVAFALLTIAFPVAQRILRRRLNWTWRDRLERWLAVPLIVAVLSLLLIPLLNLTRLAIEHNASQVAGFLDGSDGLRLWHLGALVFVLLLLLSLLGRASTRFAPWVGRIFVGLIAVIGPVLLFAAYLTLCLWQIESPYLPAGSSTVLNRALGCEQPCLVEGAQVDQRQRQGGLVAAVTGLFAAETPPDDFGQLVTELRGRGLVLTDDARVFCASSGNCLEQPASWQQDQRVWVLTNSAGTTNPCPPSDSAGGFNAADGLYCHYLKRVSPDHLRISNGAAMPWADEENLWFVLLFLVVLLFNRFFLDINIIGPHRFYRDRLSRAFLVGLGEEDELVARDGLTLSSLNAEHTSAPYHLINAALNLQADRDPGLRGRESDFFLFSKRYCGSRLTGYVATPSLEKADPHLDLGTAVAISGAAAAPNAGRQTKRSLSFVLTLLNIRLGYWLPNPRRVARRHLMQHLRTGCARPSLMWREALGLLDARHSHVNVSDGGHIENLAIYELLRRRCRLIVAIDGEQDAELRFDGLVTLLRFARIDLGVEVDFNREGENQLDALRLQDGRVSRRHWALGTIHYGDGETGQLLYIKLSYTGDEPATVRAYRELQPAFPHESTADQFFNEAQFEAYRALGEHIVEELARELPLDSLVQSEGRENWR